MSDARDTSLMGGPGPFPQTSWALLSRCDDTDPEVRQASLEQLFAAYWPPVYLFIRRNWHRDVEAAKDLTQAFFGSLLERDFLASVDADRGRFRSFVCAALTHFMANVHRAERALKRAPAGQLSLDAAAAEVGLDIADPRGLDPAVQFERDWKRALLRAVLDRLRRELRARDNELMVDALVRYDLERAPGDRLTYRQLAGQLGLSVAQLRNGLHRTRARFGELLRGELARQVQTEDDLEVELQALFG